MRCILQTAIFNAPTHLSQLDFHFGCFLCYLYPIKNATLPTSYGDNFLLNKQTIQYYPVFA